MTVGAALMEREEDMSTEGMFTLLSSLLSDADRLMEMGRTAKSRGRPNAAQAIVADLAELCGLSNALTVCAEGL